MSIIDRKRRSKSPYLWEGEKLKPQVRAFILGLAKENFPGFTGAYILGSSTTLHWTDRSDVDVNIVYPNKTKIRPLTSVAIGLGKQNIRAPSSPHPIGFYVTHEKDVKENIEKTVGAYDLVGNRWIKKPDDLYVDPEKYHERFKKQIEDVDIGLGELKRDVHDIKLIVENFKHAPEEEQQEMLSDLEEKKEEIEDDLRLLTEEYDELHKARLEAFEKELKTDGEAAANKHLYNQTLPGNVVFKTMERYGYRDLLEKLRGIYRSMPAAAK